VQHVFDVVIKNFRVAITRVESKKLVEEACQAVGLNADEVLDKYPHQLSGGQRQRLMIARAYLLKPRLIVADEPVSMIDASLRATILDIMLWMRDRHQISFLYITHDLSTAYQIADQIYVMYRGETVEQGSAQAVISTPKHPYVQLLVDSVPVPDPQVPWAANTVLKENDTQNIQGCPFYGRCPHRMSVCLSKMPPIYEQGPDQKAACYLYDSSVTKTTIQS
jgi:peptide/nickel transport system ATP-binding protein